MDIKNNILELLILIIIAQVPGFETMIMATYNTQYLIVIISASC